MDVDSIERHFAEKLETIEILEEPDVDAICWYVDDFIIAADRFVNQIVTRIINPQSAKYFHKKVPIINLYYIINAILEQGNKEIYASLFRDHIKPIFQYGFSLGDALLVNKLKDLLSIWEKQDYYPAEFIKDIYSLLDLKNAPLLNSKGTVVAVNPLSFSFGNEVQPELQEEPIEHKKRGRSWMKTIEQWMENNTEYVDHEIPDAVN